MFYYILTGFTGTAKPHTLRGAPVESGGRWVGQLAVMINGVVPCSFLEKVFLLL